LSLAACFETGKKWQQAVFFKIQASTGLLPGANLAQLGSNFQLKYLTIVFFREYFGNLITFLEYFGTG
jgi:hypothetical protein